MNVTEQASGLLVCEFGGEARSGKGTLVKDGKKEIGVEGDETGADYRIVAKHLLVEGKIDPEMDDKVITEIAGQISADALHDLTTRKEQFVKEHGFDSLYKPEVNETVPHVSKVPTVRKAVKAGFQARVAAFRDDPYTQVLLVDGRNLAPVVRQVPGVDVVMRTFVKCEPAEAARRECLRDNIPLGSDEAKKVQAAIEERNRTDAERETDPVRPDKDALSHEHLVRLNPDVDSSAGQLHLGMLAAKTGGQILFDTTHTGLTEMKTAARTMRKGALLEYQTERQRAV